MLELDKLKEVFEKVTNDVLISKGDGMRLAKKIEEFINKKCKEYKQKYKMNIGVYLTPAENLCYTSMKKFQKEFGQIDKISDHDYFTNSIHVPVWDKVDPFKKMDIEAQLAGYSNAGCITYDELDANAKNNTEALEKLVIHGMEKDLPYVAINVPSDTCNDCGYQGLIDGNCPKCGSNKIQRLRRVTRLLNPEIICRVSTSGKQQEVKDRVKHNGVEK